jgi:hypothetical protein
MSKSSESVLLPERMRGQLLPVQCRRVAKPITGQCLGRAVPSHTRSSAGASHQNASVLGSATAIYDDNGGSEISSAQILLPVCNSSASLGGRIPAVLLAKALPAQPHQSAPMRPRAGVPLPVVLKQLPAGPKQLVGWGVYTCRELKYLGVVKQVCPIPLQAGNRQPSGIATIL